MKTLILYATKHGAAREIAARIAKNMDGAVLHDLNESGIPPLAEFDCVIIGSSLYAGSIRKEAKAFLAQNADQLRGKRIGLFLSGIGGVEGGEKEAFHKNFPPDLLQEAKAACFMGGIFDPKKAGVIERFIMKIVTKGSGYIDIIRDEKIRAFATLMQA